MDLVELQAVIRRDRKRVDDLGRLAGLVEVLVQSAGVPVDVQADDARIAQEWDARVAAVPLNRLFDRAMDLDLMSSLSAGMAAKDFAVTRELTPAEVAARFCALMGDANRTIENQGHCIAALNRVAQQNGDAA